MPDYRCTFNFSAPSGVNWSEVIYRSANSLQQASLFPNALINTRLALLNALCVLTKVRVSQVGQNRVANIVNLRLNGTVNSSFGLAPPSTAAIMTLSSSVVPSSRRLWLRGLDSIMVARDATTGADKPPANFLLAVTAWIRQLYNQSFEILPLVRASTVGYGNNRVIRVDGSAANGQSVLTFNAAPGYVVGDTLILTKFSPKDFPKLNGRYQVSAVNAATVTIPYVTAQNQNLVPATGQARKLGFQSGAWIDYSISGFSYYNSHATKSSVNFTRGARRAVRVRSLA